MFVCNNIVFTLILTKCDGNFQLPKLIGRFLDRLAFCHRLKQLCFWFYTCWKSNFANRSKSFAKCSVEKKLHQLSNWFSL